MYAINVIDEMARNSIAKILVYDPKSNAAANAPAQLQGIIKYLSFVKDAK